MTAPTWVLLHYFGGSRLSWKPFMAALGSPCIAPDLRGFGDAPPGGPMRVSDYADDVAKLLPAQYVLVGHSMGGKVATALAARRPPGLRGVVLVAPSPPGPEPMADDARDTLRAAWGDEAAAHATARTLTRHSRGPAFERVVADHMRASHGAWLAWLDHGSREDLRVLAGQVQAPVLVVAGADDASLGPAVQEQQTLPALDGGTMHVLGGSRHLVPLDQPHALAAVMQAWAAGCSILPR